MLFTAAGAAAAAAEQHHGEPVKLNKNYNFAVMMSGRWQ